MKEAKYRAWDIAHKQYEYITDLYWFEENMVHGFDDERYVFEQFTGLRDKNGKEIYEGDIIRAEMALGEPPLIAPVIWYYSGFWLDHGMWHAWPDNIELREVIGNIHENPELVAKA